ncbi:MAG: amino acid ABC transporter permease [Hyphomicrobiaceae bacterium]|uniref:amino acid ABC transporter permease n=1 Tax=Pseudorhodoplanes sp. TaxID=1934341 RepID=UPI003D0B82E4
METLIKSAPYLLTGARQTILLSTVTIAASLIVGLILGVLSAVGPAWLRRLLTIYVFVLRGIPVLVAMFVMYYALPAIGIKVPGVVSVTIALVIYSTAFVTDIVRGTLLALPRGQFEAGLSLGMSRYLAARDVLLPQAVRPALAPLLNTSTMMIKSTAYASVVGVWELSYAAREVVERTLQPFEIFAGAMMIYFIICYPLSILASRLETSSLSTQAEYLRCR